MNSMDSIRETNFTFPGQKGFYKGKVRDVYNINNKLLVMVATDRISAFDVVLPRTIPYKGQVLNTLAAEFLEKTKDIVPNWVIAVPDPNVTIGYQCIPFKVEMVVRGYLAGHAWREYQNGKRTLCGVELPSGLEQNDKLPQPIITPTTKASRGHDEDISRDQIISSGIVSQSDYEQLEKYSLELFGAGTSMAADKGLILVDTKYEFGQHDGKIMVIDEIHTPDSSRYFFSDGYELRQHNGEPQKQLSKEFLREWLIGNGFQGKEGQQVPEMDDAIVKLVSDRYIELYQQISGHHFVPSDTRNMVERIENNIISALSRMG